MLGEGFISASGKRWDILIKYLLQFWKCFDEDVVYLNACFIPGNTLKYSVCSYNLPPFASVHVTILQQCVYHFLLILHKIILPSPDRVSHIFEPVVTVPGHQKLVLDPAHCFHQLFQDCLLVLFDGSHNNVRGILHSYVLKRVPQQPNIL